jgi:hypothetical protein
MRRINEEGVPSEISHLDTIGGADEHASPENSEQQKAENISALSVGVHTGIRELGQVALLLLLLTALYTRIQSVKKELLEIFGDTL